jgi:sugar phosphate isomerase/epimerase
VTAEFSARSDLNSLSAALDLARAVPGAAVNVDVLHLMRCGNRVAELAAADPALIAWSQFSDGPLHQPVERQEHEARYQRQVPGTGEFPLRDFIAALPAGVPIGVEVPAQDRLDDGESAEAWAREVVGASRRLLEGWGVPLGMR